MTRQELINRVAEDIISRDVLGDLAYDDVKRINDQGWTLDVGRPRHGANSWLRIEDAHLSESDLWEAWERSRAMLIMELAST